MPFLSPLFTLRHAFLNLLFTWILAKTCIFDVVLSEFIHPCSKKRRRAQFSIRAELTRLSVRVRFRCVCVCVCVCACVRVLQMCVWKTSNTARDCYSNNPERLICSPCAFGQSLYRVLTCEIERECTRWW